MAGLQDFFTDNTGTYGAFVQGEQRGRDINKEQALADYTAQERPLNLQAKSLANQTTEAGLGSILAKSQMDQAGLPDAIEAKKAEHLAKMDDNKLKMFGNYGQKLGMMGAYLNSIPGPARLAEFQRLAGETGIGLDRAQEFLSGDPADLPKRLQEMGREMTLSAADTIKARALQADKDAGDLKLQESRNKGMLDVAGVRVDAARETAEAKERQRQATMKAEQRFVQLNGIPASKRTPEEQAEFRSLTAFVLAQRAAAANQTGAEIVGGSPVTTPSGRISETVDAITGPQVGRVVSETLPQGAVFLKTTPDGQRVYQLPNGKKIIGD